MKIKGLTPAAVVCTGVLLVAGCGGNDGSENATVASSTAAAITTWSEWAADATRQLDSCDESNTVTVWTCYNSVVTAIDSSSRGLAPTDPQVDLLIKQFQTQYAKVLTRDCQSSIKLECQTIQAPLRLDIKALKQKVQSLA